MRKLVAIAVLVSLLTLAGCAQGQASTSAGALPGNSASASASGPSDGSSSAASGQSTGNSAESLAESAASNEPEELATPSADSANSFAVTVGEAQFTATLADTDAARALAEQLQAGPVTVSLHPYGGFEQVGPLPWSLPASDEQIATQPGDIMLYQGNQITIFTGSNSWDYTPLGRIEDATPESLLAALGNDDVEVTLSL